MNIIQKLQDLHLQATNERSHYYVASVVLEAIATLADAELTAAKERENNHILRHKLTKTQEERDGWKHQSAANAQSSDGFCQAMKEGLADQERLDWLEKMRTDCEGHILSRCFLPGDTTIRQRIDAARTDGGTQT